MRRSCLLVWGVHAKGETFKFRGGCIAMDSNVITSQKPALTWYSTSSATSWMEAAADVALLCGPFSIAARIASLV